MKAEKGYIYILECEFSCVSSCGESGYLYKVGVSENAERRVRLLGGPDTPFTVSLVCNRTFGMEECYDLLTEIKAEYGYREHGGKGWFLLDAAELRDMVCQIMDRGAKLRRKLSDTRYMEEIGKMSYRMEPRCYREDE